MNILYTAFVLLLCVAGPLTLAWRRSLPFTSKKTKKSLAMVATEVKAERAQNWLDKFDYHKEDKLPWSKDGYKSWAWKGHKINYVDVGGDDLKSKKPPLLLIHGFGASSYHWRYNIPILARKYHVFAIDLLGFGLSDKPIIEYSADIWRDEVLDFISEIVHPLTNKQGCVVAGNSLGGFTALYASASSRATDENLITGCILLNAAGTFRSSESVDTKKEKNAIIEFIKAKFQKFIIGLSFIYTKQPARIAQVLKQVYSVDPTNVDDDLVASIQYPAQDPNAAEVFFRVISRNAAVPTKYVDELLSDLKLPLMLLWGMKDPWIRPITADRIQELKPDLVRVNLEAGHCPHDEVPNEVNEAILNFAQSIYK